MLTNTDIKTNSNSNSLILYIEEKLKQLLAMHDI